MVFYAWCMVLFCFGFVLRRRRSCCLREARNGFAMLRIADERLVVKIAKELGGDGVELFLLAAW